ncbi:MAG: NAD(P)-dependent oxidoreductase [Candidatus Rokubacteria bacterium]|nr:NAD(P)-dependent oxidoreductase [Candidatus Rokubacteria bacterium]
MQPTVGVVGLGLLGHAVAFRLLAAGHGVIGYDVLPEKVHALAALGGKPAPSAEAVARAAEVVCTLLPSLATVEAAVLGPEGVVAGARAGQTLVQMSTISPALTERLAREAGARGLAFLDCPVSGTSAMVARGEGILLVGGERAVFERWRPLLETILPRAVYIGRAGQATVVKLAANLLVGLHTAAAAEALSLVRKAGLDPARVLDVLTASAGTSRMLELRGPMMVRHEFPPQMKLELFLKDLGLIVDVGTDVGAPLPLTTLARRLYAAAAADGHGGEDLAVVTTALEGWRHP